MDPYNTASPTGYWTEEAGSSETSPLSLLGPGGLLDSSGNESLSEWLLHNQLAQTDILRLLQLRKPHSQLDSFWSMWWYMTFWLLVSSLVVHLIAACVCAICLNRHTCNLCLTFTLFVGGVVCSCFLGSISTAALAFAIVQSTQTLPPLYAFVLGVGQTMCYLLISFSKIPATL